MWGARQAAMAEENCAIKRSAGGSFRTIAGKGKNEHVNKADLSSMAPGFEGKGPGHGDGASKPGIESSPT